MRHVKQVFVAGIDLAQNLNYCGIVIGNVTDQIRYSRLYKFNHVLYPNIQNLITNVISKEFNLATIAIDYSNNEGFSEYVEAHYNPSFLNTSSANYHKWKKVMPVKFTTSSKLDMKQNSRVLHEAGLVRYPNPDNCSAEQQALVYELIEQSKREAATETARGLTFPKPQGHDNDLAIANELMLLAAKPFLKGFVSSNPSHIGVSVDMDSLYGEQSDNTYMESRLKKRIESTGADARYDISYPE